MNIPGRINLNRGIHVTWDDNLFYLINGMATQSEILDWAMEQLSREGNLVFPIVLLLGYWAWTNWREARIAAPTLGLLILLSDFLGAQLKLMVARVRPCHVLTQIHELNACGGTFSMPSNHAVNSATAAAFLAILYPRTGWVTWPLVGFIGWSRVYLGAHYVSDVMVGWVLGGALGASVGWGLTHWSKFGRVNNMPSTDLKGGNGII